MSVALYFDQHVPKAIAVGVRERGVDVLKADEDGKGLNSLPAPIVRITPGLVPC